MSDATPLNLDIHPNLGAATLLANGRSGQANFWSHVGEACLIGELRPSVRRGTQVKRAFTLGVSGAIR
jgi:hypothetical protein